MLSELRQEGGVTSTLVSSGYKEPRRWRQTCQTEGFQTVVHKLMAEITVGLHSGKSLHLHRILSRWSSSVLTHHSWSYWSETKAAPSLFRETLEQTFFGATVDVCKKTWMLNYKVEEISTVQSHTGACKTLFKHNNTIKGNYVNVNQSLSADAHSVLRRGLIKL